MAGGGGGMEIPQRVKRGSKAHKRKKKHRLGFRLDMTPLVDVAFLLLTFFMYTTSLITPQIMEMTVPKDAEDVKVDEKNLFTLQIAGNGKIFWKQGAHQDEDPSSIDIKALKAKAVELNMMRRNQLITSFQASPDAPYGEVIKVLDVLNQAEGEIIQKMRSDNPNEKRARKFAFVKLKPEDDEKLKGMAQ